ncbi:DUF4163 domain-containing protein [Microbulbifer salipaludis]|uniref:DUF4163 domain-containing protein n=1 Tax=Microbulbifer salipaludis TaxID=187980 RepID=A0ABS3E1Y4_9GAMM|nr:DUF3298 and DUF4163 domain-containing protein [Microbulbifer salipaludis]MBN8429296.1 DUF4163 domain-containing protein [Microbulbifer salipaludis]
MLLNQNGVLNSMRPMLQNSKLLKTVTVILLVISAVSGCEKENSEPAAALNSEAEALEMLAPNCASPEDCTSVSIRREVYIDHPALNDAVYEQLLQQLQGDVDSSTPSLDSLDKVAQKFIDDAADVADMSAARWELNGDTKMLARRGDVLTIVISSYVYSGGAHGMPVRHWLNWDLAKQSKLSLADVIEAEKEDEFWQAAEEAHRQWLDAQGADADFRQNWPFARSSDFRMTDDGLELLYGVYTLGPYSMGEVTLTLPMEKIAGLLRAPYR